MSEVETPYVTATLAGTYPGVDVTPAQWIHWPLCIQPGADVAQASDWEPAEQPYTAEDKLNRDRSISETVRHNRAELERLQALPWQRVVRELAADRDRLAAEVIRLRVELENVTAERDRLSVHFGDYT